ncbi:ATP-binding cassette sub- G member 2 [Dinochytrium kinnereticum]|nr:ATP-binding cassette sub- G member 2 [Dinochytrium kinnereticum]
MDLLTIDSSKSDEEVKKDLARIDSLQKSFGDSKVTGLTSGGAVRVLDGVETVEERLEREDKQPGVREKSLQWSNNWFEELGILVSRSWAQFVRGRGIMIAFLIRTIILILLIGFTFFRLKNDQKGIQNRIGVLFFWPVNQVFNTIMPILGVFPLERVIMLRERSTRSYRVSSFFFSKVLTEIIPATFFTLLACIPLYFMMGLRLDDPVAFIRFQIIQWAEVMVCLAVGFLIGAAVPSIQLAQVVGPLVGVVFLLYGGVLINNEDLPVFFRGFQYISPVNYAYRANMFNEYQGAALSCPDDPNIPCFRTGEQVLRQYAVTDYSLWGCVGILAALFAGYLLIGYTLLRILGRPKDVESSFPSHHKSAQMMGTDQVVAMIGGCSEQGIAMDVKASGKRVAAVEAAPEFSTVSLEEGRSVRAPVGAWDHKLAWSNISYEISQGKKGSRQILKNLSGNVKSGEMVAIMGSSGAGKTTLLNCLSGRLATGTLSGNILYNGKPRDPRTWRKTMAFVEQQDVLYSQITVRETLRYAARLRLPSSHYTVKEKDKRADDVLKSLRLSKAADTRIGDENVRGVSGGEKKRTAIGQELVGNPEILFLDEPTSGLDSNSALAVMDNVKQDAISSGRIVIATIHQPSFQLLSLFHTVILLSGGSVVYMGSPLTAVDYFSSLGYPLTDPTQNPADFFMDILTIDSSKSEEEMKRDMIRIDTLQKAFLVHDSTRLVGTTVVPIKVLDHVETVEDLLEREDKGLASKPGNDEVKRLQWANNWFDEFCILCNRSWLQFARGKSIMVANLARTVIQALILGFTFYRLKRDQRSIQNRLGLLFFIPADDIFNVITTILLVFPFERVIMLRERATRSYRVSSFFLSKFVTEAVPSSFYCALSSTSLYLIVGLRLDDPFAIFRYMFILWIEVLGCVAVGFLIGAAVPSMQIAQIVGPLIGLLFLLYGGSLVNNEDLPVIFKGFQYISPANYVYRALMINEFQGLKLTCSDDPNLPCFSEGEQVLQQYSLTRFSIWTCVAITAGLFAGFLLLAYAVLRRFAKPKTKLV